MANWLDDRLVQTVIDDSDGLPTVLRTEYNELSPATSAVEEALRADLAIERLERIVPYLWLVGLPYLPRPLNVQAVLGRTIVPTTDITLHLVWTSGKIYIKALPSYILKTAFYTQLRLKAAPKSSSDASALVPSTAIGSAALGLLHSYLALLPTELDFDLAKSAHLLPAKCNWRKWRKIAQHIVKECPSPLIYEHIPQRYSYGELRLGRLDKIYRILRGDWLHGFSRSTNSTRYVDFFAEHLGSVAAATVYIVVVLTAMQVGLATNGLSKSDAFQSACHAFAIFAIISPIVVVGTALLVLLILVLANLWGTWRTQKRQRKERRKHD